MRVADYLISFLYDSLGIDTLFMVSGGGIMHLTDAIACHGKIRYVCSHNEQATTMEADGYAKASGGFGAALVTTGPGATNAITGVVGAWQDSTKMFVVSGQSKRAQTIHGSGLPGLRQFGVQEAHILPMIASVTKYAAMLDDPGQVRYHLEKARFLAGYGRPGPVWIDVPLDVQGALIDPETLPGFDPVAEGYDVGPAAPDAAVIAQVLDALAQARRPVVVAGHGVRVAGATDQFLRLVEELGLPVVTPRLGIDLMETSHPLYVGRPGIKGDRAGNFAVQNADLLLCIGTRLSINVTGHEYEKFARDARRIVVDIDEVEHRKPTVPIDLFIRSDAGAFVESLIAAWKGGSCGEPAWAERCREWKNRYPVALPEYGADAEAVPNTYHFTKLLSERLSPEAVVVIDSGSSSYVVSQSIAMKKGARFLASGGLGAMGYAVPAAIGAAVASPGKQVVCITGDGSLHMNVQELQTLAHERLPVKIFVFNNHGYASIRTTQHTYFADRFVGVDHRSGVPLPDLLQVAALYGIKGVRIVRTAGISAGIAEVLAENGPVICDLHCAAEQAIVPTVFSKKLENGAMVSLPLEDMYPFLDRDLFLREMIVKPLPESL